MRASKLVLYNFEWQALRTSLNFSGFNHSYTSIRRLKEYLTQDWIFDKGGEKSFDAHWAWNGFEPEYVYRVLNLMCAVNMGISGSKKIAKSEKTISDINNKAVICTKFREKLSAIYKRVRRDNGWLHCDTEEEQLRDLRGALKDDLVRVYRSLWDRWVGSGSIIANRPELRAYLYLIEKVADERGIDLSTGRHIQKEALCG